MVPGCFGVLEAISVCMLGEGFSHQQQAILLHLGVLKLNSIVTVSIRTQHQAPQTKGSFL